jgi:hypothetical protein
MEAVLVKLWAGIDAGKAHHHCVVIDADGNRLLSRKIPNDEPALLELIALICAGYEKTIQKDSWRSAEKRHFHYLNQLTTWGYTASAVEQIILNKHTIDTE